MEVVWHAVEFLAGVSFTVVVLWFGEKVLGTNT